MPRCSRRRPGASVPRLNPASPCRLRSATPRAILPAPGNPRGHGSVHALVYTTAFSSGGRILATGTSDGMVRLWDVRSRRLIGAPLDTRRPTGSPHSTAPGRRRWPSARTGGLSLSGAATAWPGYGGQGYRRISSEPCARSPDALSPVRNGRGSYRRRTSGR
ncbi:hypothetical protein [Sphaerisporangium dianthi]|uniref:Anaphase-promoting complex subunit 4 WD40 domain-containing protein n=1 Tax=Sphaerisporangium dianthi TaxID=1436120 RepID=A0ABV9CI88_9ACTN